MRTLLKYLRLHWAFFRASIAADVEYRMNFFTRIFTDIIWYLAQIITFEVIYRQTPVLGTWNVERTRIFLGILFMVDALYMFFVHDNLENLPTKVSRGELDLLLAKPVNSQFMISLQRVSTAFAFNFLMGFTWFAVAVYRYPEPIHWTRLLWLLILVPSGLLVFYCLRFLFSTVSLITVRAENFHYLWYQVYRLGMRPDTIYQPWMKYLVLTALPVALVASVPARALLEPPNYGLFIWAIFVGAACLYVTIRFWNFAIRRYSSASS